MPPDTPLVSRARELARRAHQAQKRKASGLPYFTHLEAVAQILEDHGYRDETTLAAAYLHDLIEDQPSASAELYQTMPSAVIELVEALTEQKLDPSGQKRAKAERFEGYLEGLSTASDSVRRAIPISCADRIHNMLSIVTDEQCGRSPFMQLTTRPGELIKQQAALRNVYRASVAQNLLQTYDNTCRDLTATIERWLPGRAALIAAQAHLGQFDKGGHPYILHPMRLALRASTPEERVVALLHDVVEDSHVTLEMLEREGFGPDILRALEHLTRRRGEDYQAFIERVARQRLATRVKLLDLEDNSDLSRLTEVTAKDLSRVAEYGRAIERLEAELGKRSLYVVLDPACRAALAREASLPVFKAEHVTLAYRVEPSQFESWWIPGGHAVGSHIKLSAVERIDTEHLELFVIEIAGQTTRPHDNGTLHLTLSRGPGARSRDANRLLESAPRTPCHCELEGHIAWIDD